MLNASFVNDQLQPPIGAEDVKYLGVTLVANSQFSGPTLLGQVSSANASCIQTITRSGTPTAGAWTITFGNSVRHRTTSLAFLATAAAVQAALEALPNIGKGNVTVGLAGQVYTVTFTGELANKPQPLLLVEETTDVTYTVAQTQAGVQNGAFGPYDDGASDGRQTARGILVNLGGLAVAPNGRVTTGAVASGGEFGGTVPAVAVAVVGGVWDTSKIAGVDANAIADLGRLVSGTAANGLLSLR